MQFFPELIVLDFIKWGINDLCCRNFRVKYVIEIPRSINFFQDKQPDFVKVLNNMGASENKHTVSTSIE
ncbi:hypothetical protein FAEPRAM212_03215 [Faecalibacterium prausnitzii M21/2]|uniref:Uncharacterized protein n=1 Tax=Faecalibacterium prausnitzii M21/2 TaxID=411485 RepID=A8SH04_9FIRM|nr:hypothetical protein FAEPRAM212_03215 [Faecalibacterium prausnitzii M21/2]